MTPTAEYQFDVPPADEPLLIAGLTPNCGLLRCLEGQLAANLTDLSCLIVAHVRMDAQHLWLWCQRLPYLCLVATPAEEH